jgi:hypothetical protein
MIHACGSHALGAGRDDGVINGGAPIFLGVVLSERPCVKMCVCVCVCVCVSVRLPVCLPAASVCVGVFLSMCCVERSHFCLQRVASVWC